MSVGNYSGVSKVEYATAGTSFAAPVDLGKPLAESSGYTPEIPTVETGKGTMLYAGKKGVASYLITDMSKFSALETIMKADTEIDIRITDTESNLETILLAASVQVKKVIASAVGTRTHFELTAQAFSV